MSSADTANSLCDGNACTSQRAVDAANEADSAATISDIGFVAGGGLLATGVMLFLLGGDDPGDQRRTGGLEWSPSANGRGITLEVSGTW
jgi:hypothetical protein